MKSHLIVSLLVSCLAPLTLSGCPSAPVRAQQSDPPFKPPPTDQLRLVLIGDTGSVNDHMRSLRAAVMRERKDAVVVLGDVVYPYMPECRGGFLTPDALVELEAKVGAQLRGLGAPVLITLGNHDTDWGRANSPRQVCLQTYAARYQDLVFPGENYLVDWGVALLALVNTNRLSAGNGRMVREAFSARKGWKIGMGHHVLKTYRDKEGERLVARWLKRERITPDLWANGHAHVLQYGVYYGIPALTSGAGAHPRKRKSCPPKCGEGERWGTSDVGYAVLDITAARMGITFKDTDGRVLYQTAIDRPAEKKGAR